MASKKVHCGSLATAASVLKSLFVICTLSTVLIACKKDKHDPEPARVDLEVAFGQSSIDYSLVDSGFVVLKKAGSANQVFKRFNKGSNLMSFSLDDLSRGDWTAEMYIFARFNASGGRRYKQEKTFTVPAGGARQGIRLNAPTGKITDAWKPCAFFRHEELGVSVAVALDNTDPHFDIQVQDNRWDLFYIERYANNRLSGGANAKVGELIWHCDTNCYTRDKFINDDTSFLPFTREVGSQEWNNGLIIVVVSDNEGADVQFSHVYTK